MSTPTGLARRELYVDARDLQSETGETALTAAEYAALLTARGREKLAAAPLRRAFSAEVRTLSPTYIYGEDFVLGDTVTVTDERLGVSADAVVTAARHTVGENGRTLTLTFGAAPPTLHEVLRKAGI